MSVIQVLKNLRKGPPVQEEECPSSVEQEETEHLITKTLAERSDVWGPDMFLLHRHAHTSYLTSRLGYLPSSYESLDASQPWLCFWVVHGLHMLGAEVDEETRGQLINLIHDCQRSTGGFGGGPGQMAHLATTYGSVNCLAALCCESALTIIDRAALRDWLLSIRQSDGSFRLHEGGEIDIRGAYCAVAVASLVQLDLEELFPRTPQWIAKCQTYEGGLGGRPWSEAHAGYTFCGLAALVLLGKTEIVDMDRLVRWAAQRQMAIEGGFQGRTNKLVDSCYSFWMGAIFPLVGLALNQQCRSSDHKEATLYNTQAVQEFVLACCQKPPAQISEIDIAASGGGGGLIEQPGMNADPYHTCYAVCGLALAQQVDGDSEPLGGLQNHLPPLDPRYNLSVEAVEIATEFFAEFLRE